MQPLNRSSKQKSHNLRLSETNLDILQELGTVHLLTTNMIQSRHYPNDSTGKSTIRRLKQFAKHGLTKPLANSLHSRAGYCDVIHRLTPEGVAVLNLQRPEVKPRLLHKDPHPSSVPHRLMVAETMLSIIDACALYELQQPTLIHEFDSLPGADMESKLCNRYILHEMFPLPGGGTIACRPDLAALLKVPRKNQSTVDSLVILFEMDRSTETHRQFFSRLPALFEVVNQKLPQTYFEDNLTNAEPAIRLFWIFETEERLRNIATCLLKDPLLLFSRKRNRGDVLYYIEGRWQMATAQHHSTAASFLSRHVRMTVRHELKTAGSFLSEKIWRTPYKLEQPEHRCIFTPTEEFQQT